MSTIKGIGFDLVDTKRFRNIAEKRPNLLLRLFSRHDLDYSNKFSDPMPHLAARFAVKEAYLKAIGTGIGPIALKDIEIRHEESGQPFIMVKETKVNAMVSISHTDTTAGAVVILLE